MHKFTSYLTKLIKEVMLDEISIKQLKEKHSDLIEDIDFAIEVGLPNKYFQWYINNVKRSERALTDLINAAMDFENVLKTKKIDNLIAKGELPKGANDIVFWQNKSFDDFKKAVDIAEKVVSNTKDVKQKKEEGVKKLYDDGKVVVFEILTKEASCLYGANTKWCISGKEASYYYNDYVKNGARFLFIINSKPIHRRFEKIAIKFKNDSREVEIFDVMDWFLFQDEYKQAIPNETKFFIEKFLGFEIKINTFKTLLEFSKMGDCRVLERYPEKIDSLTQEQLSEFLRRFIHNTDKISEIKCFIYKTKYSTLKISSEQTKETTGLHLLANLGILEISDYPGVEKILDSNGKSPIDILLDNPFRIGQHVGKKIADVIAEIEDPRILQKALAKTFALALPVDKILEILNNPISAELYRAKESEKDMSFFTFYPDQSDIKTVLHDLAIYLDFNFNYYKNHEILKIFLSNKSVRSIKNSNGWTPFQRFSRSQYVPTSSQYEHENLINQFK